MALFEIRHIEVEEAEGVDLRQELGAERIACGAKRGKREGRAPSRPPPSRSRRSATLPKASSRCVTQAACAMHTKNINTIPAIRIGYLLICKLNPLFLYQSSCISQSHVVASGWITARRTKAK